MLEYSIKRVFMAIVTLLVIATITFFSMNAVPGGPFNSEKAMSPEVQQVLIERYNLDKPVGQQFVLYLGNLLKGDLGVSIKTGRDVSETIKESFAISAELGGKAIAVAIIFGLVFGCLAALYQGGTFDRIVLFFATLFISVPNFVVASILIMVFCLKLQWFPVWSIEAPSYILPVIALSLHPMSSITRYVRTSMLDVMGQDYIRTAKSLGLKDINIIFRLALKNACIPVITYIGPMVAGILTGSIVIETAFTIGGLGSKFVTAITNRDYTMIMGTTIFLATIIIAINLISDLVYKIVDPRIKLS